MHFFSCRAAPVLTQGKEPFPAPALPVVPRPVTATTHLPEDLCLRSKHKLTRYHTEATGFLQALLKAAPLIVAWNGSPITASHLSWLRHGHKGKSGSKPVLIKHYLKTSHSNAFLHISSAGHSQLLASMFSKLVYASYQLFPTGSIPANRLNV